RQAGCGRVGTAPAVPAGLGPTMGAFHAGHLALFRAARAENDVVVASLFVNPAQFGLGEDLTRYPRDEARDEALADEAGVDVLFVPSVDEMYPPGFQTWVAVEELSRGLEGAARPGHFRGVATVCLKLFSIVRPRRAYFGQKDAQQAAVVKRLVRDLELGIEIRVVPTVRDSDGLALSSRNAYLSPEHRARDDKIVMVTAYDASSGRLADQAGIDLILVGDTAAMVVLGHESSTVPVTMEEMLFMTRAAARGARRPLVVGDMPFGSYQVSDEDAVRNAIRFVKEGGADVVKLEGAGPSLSRVRAIVGAGI